MEWIKGLPFVDIANAAVILLTGFLAAFGLQRGKKPSAGPAPTSPSHVEVAGALVDSSSVKLLAGELAGQAVSVTAQTAATRDQTEELEELRHAINRLREALDRIAMEIVRSR